MENGDGSLNSFYEYGYGYCRIRIIRLHGDPATAYYTRGPMTPLPPISPCLSFLLLHIFLFESSLSIKLFHLFCTSSVLNTDCTIVFDMMRRTKLDSLAYILKIFYKCSSLYINFSFDVIEEVATIYIYKLPTI